MSRLTTSAFPWTLPQFVLLLRHFGPDVGCTASILLCKVAASRCCWSTDITSCQWLNGYRKKPSKRSVKVNPFSPGTATLIYMPWHLPP
ncbi:uncharacterized protein EI97DRAFT_90751 [Westerdykella ornata]|uniref:Secreted protein n=1 Tax=Westerdykella ornata TaxID=318751 RepID=A0A6A6JFS0_WESOR|nr:uncharacterized protein EI97DRAFT_90751 [Westerdykella ornata]KAF2274838.1 hypothetical protein EI97DRAFT_90751 [Westerdykella ornata]